MPKETKRYVILDVHPEDFYYEFRHIFLGQIINVSYCKTSRGIGGGYVYCTGRFDETIVSENIIIRDIVFKAVLLGEL